MFNKVLVANRGEIALRVMRACRELGIRTVAIYSEADRDSLHVAYADEAYCIGPPPPAESYLNVERIIDVAEKSGAEAVHPGYGFLAESPEFAKACEEAGLKFIGPTPSSMELMEDKVATKRLVAGAGIPVIPGPLEPVEDAEEAVEVAEELGYPVLLKAAFGGGGRGLRVARDGEEVRRAFEVANREARLAFGKPGIYVEKFIERPRHIEFQVLADEHGRIIHLGERECSIQRRYQKVIEEAPSPVVDEETRELVGEWAIRAARALGYVNAGTVEFVRDGEGHFYFIEVNKRIQVEHLVTEMVTGVDLVKAQVRIAAGEELWLGQDDVVLRGHAINCRICAEDPFNGFVPCPGRVLDFRPPGGPGVRVDTALYPGYTVPIHYDSLIAKLATWGVDRREAVARMRNALDELVIEGIRTNIPLHKAIMADGDFLEGRIHTQYLDEKLEFLLSSAQRPGPEDLALVAAVASILYRSSKRRLVLPRTRSSRRTSAWRSYGRFGAPGGGLPCPLGTTA
ncbi:acetyl-CoA carboxylase biotin carboxylase subunit [Candidatus Bathyarchaeota archaeon]|nr:MAG: acetyl-CoA carboxylase biotin carboxylase subunit [Candidatus Bathyarchaeota archaeon]